MSLLMKELSILARSAQVVEVDRDRLAANTLLGRVVMVSEHVLLLEGLDENYEYDGMTAVRPGDITRLRADNRELRVASRLAPKPQARPRFSEVGLLEISAAMSILAKTYSCVTLHAERATPGMCFPGEPVELDDDFLVFRHWGTTRSLDQTKLVIRLEEITRVDADTKYQRMLVRARELEAGQVPIKHGGEVN